MYGGQTLITKLKVVSTNVMIVREIQEIQQLHPWEQPEKPWKCLHIDFAGPFCGSMWLVLVDAQSKWPEVMQMKSTTASKTVEVLRSLFSRFGIPHQLVSDNGPQFVSDEYKQFC